MNNNKYKILLVEDEGNICRVIQTLLEASGYQAVCAHTCAMAQTLYASHRPDLVLLDLGLPDADGMTLLRQIRQQALTPVIVLSARADEQDKVSALDSGANDYVTKPFGAAELLARVRTALRNYRYHTVQGDHLSSVFTCRGLVIHYDARQVFLNDDEIKLTQTEYNVLSLLSTNCGKMMTYAAIIKAIWGETAHESNIKKLQVNMANIRKKLGLKPGENDLLINELGVGYRLNADK